MRSIKSILCFAGTLGALSLFPQPLLSDGTSDFSRFFDMSMEELMNVEVITSGKIEEKIKNVPASVVVITREEIEAYGYRSLVEILTQVPGMFNIADGAYFYSFGFRGYWNPMPQRNIVVLINGVRQSEDFSAASRLEAVQVPVEAIDRIEVIRGPMSILYGTGAFYGVINIFTNETDPLSSYHLASMTTGTGGSFRTSLLSKGSQDRLNYSMSLTGGRLPGLNARFSDMGSQGDILGRGKENFSDGYYSHRFFHFNLWLESKGLWASVNYDQVRMGTSFLFQPLDQGDGSPEMINFTRIAAGYKGRIAPGWTLDTKLHLSRYDDHFDIELLPDGFEMQNLQASMLNGEVNLFNSSIQNWDLMAGYSVHIGYDLYNFYDLPGVGLSNFYFDTDGEPIITHAMYSQVKWSVKDYLLWIGGVRFEKQQSHALMGDIMNGTPDADVLTGRYDRDEIYCVPRTALHFLLNDRHIVKCLYGEAINRPAFFEKVDLLGEPYPQLDAETIRTVELNYLGAFSSRFSVLASLFRNEMRNLIVRTNGFNESYDYYSYWSNSGRLSNWGFEFQMNLSLSPDSRVEAAVTWQESKDETAPDREVAYSPRWTGVLKASMRVASHLTLALTANYMDTMTPFWETEPMDPFDPQAPETGRIGEKVGDYVTFSANIRVDDWPVKNIYLNLHGQNLLDSEFFYPTTTNNVWAPKGFLHEGRRLQLTLGWNLQN